MATQLIGAPCPQTIAVQTQSTLIQRVIQCQQGLNHPLDIHTGEHRRPDGSRLVVTWGEG